VICYRDEVHAALAQEAVEVARVGITVGKVESPKEPFFGARAEAGMKVEIAAAHGWTG
jgi:hypothetical protein